MKLSVRSGSTIRRRLTLSNWYVTVIPMICLFAALSVVFLMDMREKEIRQTRTEMERACAEADRWLDLAAEALSMLGLDVNVQNAMSRYAARRRRSSWTIGIFSAIGWQACIPPICRW